jgi:Acyl-CoA synthetases (AMP-forming)/AMP-acid ligases II
MEDIRQKIFSIASFEDFETLTLRVFAYQYANNKCYNQWCNLLGSVPQNTTQINQIPFLPIEFFKTHKVVSNPNTPLDYFLSSGTTGTEKSYHYIFDFDLYKQSFNSCFTQFFSEPCEYCFIALLPNYLQQQHSSLIYMINSFISQSCYKESGFYKDNLSDVICILKELEGRKIKTILFGVTYALLDLIELEPLQLQSTLVFETGGMKGRRKETSKPALHALLKEGFGVGEIYSEYGMCELFSQAYSKGNGIFECPKQMKVVLSDIYDPLTIASPGAKGRINIIDLANIDSCAFIATQDAGKMVSDKAFELLGRIEGADTRGCNLLYE